MLVKHSLKQGGISLSHGPLLHLLEGVHKEVDVIADLVIDRRAMNEKQACCNPHGECKGWSQFVQHAVIDHILAQ